MEVIDLSRLPAPQIVDVPDFETLLAERKAAFVALYPVDEQDAVRRTLALESEPVTKLLQESTYREILLRQRINEAAQAVMVAYSMGNDLEQLAANCNVKRLTVVPADNDAVPPVAAVMESDEALRQRIPAAFEGLTVIGSPLLIVVPIPVLLPAGCIRVNPGKKRQPVLSVVERKPPPPKSRKQNREIIWWERMKTCWFLIVPTPTGAMQSAQQKCSGNVCSAGLLHFPCCSLRGGLISIRKCR